MDTENRSDLMTLARELAPLWKELPNGPIPATFPGWPMRPADFGPGKLLGRREAELMVAKCNYHLRDLAHGAALDVGPETESGFTFHYGDFCSNVKTRMMMPGKLARWLERRQIAEEVLARKPEPQRTSGRTLELCL